MRALPQPVAYGCHEGYGDTYTHCPVHVLWGGTVGRHDELAPEGGTGWGRKRTCAQRTSTLRVPLERGLCIGADRRPQYISAPLWCMS